MKEGETMETEARALTLTQVMELGSNDRSKVTFQDGNYVFVRALTGAEVREYRKILGGGGRIVVKGDQKDRSQEMDLDVGAAALYLVKAGTLNKDGSQMFADTSTEELGALPFPILDAIGSEIHQLTGLGADDEDAEPKDPTADSSAGSNGTPT